MIIEYIVSIGTERLWTGAKDLVLDGVYYTPTYWLMNIGTHSNELSQPDNRLQITMPLLTAESYNLIKVDPGPVEVVIELIKSTDLGQTWTKPGSAFYGILSSNSVKGGLVDYEIETPLGDLDHGKPGYWTHEDQLERDPTDLGFEYVADLEIGIDRQKWPP